jgi:hypothetical protein
MSDKDICYDEIPPVVLGGTGARRPVPALRPISPNSDSDFRYELDPVSFDVIQTVSPAVTFSAFGSLVVPLVELQDVQEVEVIAECPSQEEESFAPSAPESPSQEESYAPSAPVTSSEVPPPPPKEQSSAVPSSPKEHESEDQSEDEIEDESEGSGRWTPSSSPARIRDDSSDSWSPSQEPEEPEEPEESRPVRRRRTSRRPVSPPSSTSSVHPAPAKKKRKKTTYPPGSSQVVIKTATGRVRRRVKDGAIVKAIPKKRSRRGYTAMEDNLAKLEAAKAEYLSANGGFNKVFLHQGKSRGSGYAAIARKHGISTMTLVRFVKRGPAKPPGRPSAMSNEEESVLAGLVRIRANWGFALSFSKLKVIVEEYMRSRYQKEMELWIECGHSSTEEGHPKPYFFAKGSYRHYPGRWWMRSFILRHPELTTRLAENRRMAYSSITKELIEE